MSMLKDKLMKHLAKKGAKDLDPMDKEAKMGVIKELGRQAGSMMKDKIHPMGKVEVASNSAEGLHQGLQKADSLLDHSAGDKSVADHTGSSPDHEAMAEGSPKEEAHESVSEALAEGDVEPMEHDAAPGESEHELAEQHADKSPDELDAHIQKLTALKHKKLSGRA